MTSVAHHASRRMMDGEHKADWSDTVFRVTVARPCSAAAYDFAATLVAAVLCGILVMEPLGITMYLSPVASSM
jgi:hypothetical protein